MKTYKIGVHGCDDSTEIEMELTETEWTLVRRIARKITETSTYGCMPTMEIEEVKEESKYE